MNNTIELATARRPKQIALNTAVGTRDLCAWQPVPGIVWIQTLDAGFARALSQRKDGRLVAYGVAGGLLRTYEFAQPLSWALALMARYTAGETPTNGAKNHAV